MTENQLVLVDANKPKLTGEQKILYDEILKNNPKFKFTGLDLIDGSALPDEILRQLESEKKLIDLSNQKDGIEKGNSERIKGLVEAKKTKDASIGIINRFLEGYKKGRNENNEQRTNSNKEYAERFGIINNENAKLGEDDALIDESRTDSNIVKTLDYIRTLEPGKVILVQQNLSKLVYSRKIEGFLNEALSNENFKPELLLNNIEAQPKKQAELPVEDLPIASGSFVNPTELCAKVPVITSSIEQKQEQHAEYKTAIEKLENVIEKNIESGQISNDVVGKILEAAIREIDKQVGGNSISIGFGLMKKNEAVKKLNEICNIITSWGTTDNDKIKAIQEVVGTKQVSDSIPTPSDEPQQTQIYPTETSVQELKNEPISESQPSIETAEDLMNYVTINMPNPNEMEGNWQLENPYSDGDDITSVSANSFEEILGNLKNDAIQSTFTLNYSKNNTVNTIYFVEEKYRVIKELEQQFLELGYQKITEIDADVSAVFDVENSSEDEITNTLESIRSGKLEHIVIQNGNTIISYQKIGSSKDEYSGNDEVNAVQPLPLGAKVKTNSPYFTKNKPTSEKWSVKRFFGSVESAYYSSKVSSKEKLDSLKNNRFVKALPEIVAGGARNTVLAWEAVDTFRVNTWNTGQRLMNQEPIEINTLGREKDDNDENRFKVADNSKEAKALESIYNNLGLGFDKLSMQNPFLNKDMSVVNGVTAFIKQWPVNSTYRNLYNLLSFEDKAITKIIGNVKKIEDQGKDLDNEVLQATEKSLSQYPIFDEQGNKIARIEEDNGIEFPVIEKLFIAYPALLNSKLGEVYSVYMASLKNKS